MGGKGYSPMRRWLRQERNRGLHVDSGEQLTGGLTMGDDKKPSQGPWGKELFWPQTTSSSDDVCISCGNLRSQGHRLDCDLAKAVDTHAELLEMLRELEWADTESSDWQGEDACLFCGRDKPNDRHPNKSQTGHAPDCRLGTLLDRFRSKP